jgi:hypothetical protein
VEAWFYNNKFNMVGICISESYAHKWIIKFSIYKSAVLISLPIFQTNLFEEI